MLAESIFVLVPPPPLPTSPFSCARSPPSRARYTPSPPIWSRVSVDRFRATPPRPSLWRVRRRIPRRKGCSETQADRSPEDGLVDRVDWGVAFSPWSVDGPCKARWCPFSFFFFPGRKHTKYFASWVKVDAQHSKPFWFGPQDFSAPQADAQHDLC